ELEPLVAATGVLVVTVGASVIWRVGLLSASAAVDAASCAASTADAASALEPDFESVVDAALLPTSDPEVAVCAGVSSLEPDLLSAASEVEAALADAEVETWEEDADVSYGLSCED
ncbi:hypothetical protein BBO99_00009573, partial [Phytophthora kernoviae]